MLICSTRVTSIITNRNLKTITKLTGNKIKRRRRVTLVLLAREVGKIGEGAEKAGSFRLYYLPLVCHVTSFILHSHNAVPGKPSQP